jgi:TolB-like protein
MRQAAATLLCMFAAATAQAAPPGGKVKVAVTDIKNVQGVAPGTATILSDIIVSEVAGEGYAVISQADIDAMLGFERKKQMLGCSEETSCLAEIGGALGVEYLFTGQVGKIGSRFRISLMIVDARKAVVVARAAQFTDADEDALAKGSEQIVGKLLEELAALRKNAAVARREAAEPKEERRVEGKAEPKKDAKKEAKSAVEQRDVPLPPPPGVAEAKDDRPRPGAARRTGWWLVGGGGGLLLVGTGAGIQARKELTKLSEAWRWDPARYQQEYDSRTKASKTLSVIADTCFVAGAGLVGWGAWKLLRKAPPPVSFAPVPMPGGAGLVAAGSF